MQRVSSLKLRCVCDGRAAPPLGHHSIAAAKYLQRADRVQRRHGLRKAQAPPLRHPLPGGQQPLAIQPELPCRLRQTDALHRAQALAHMVEQQPLFRDIPVGRARFQTLSQRVQPLPLQDSLLARRRL